MRKLIFLCCLLASAAIVNGQRIFRTDSAVVKFESARNADVSAVNSKVITTINADGLFTFDMLIRDFKFAMGEMEDHFNDNYMESNKYPNASFKGRIFDFKKINLTRPGSYKVKAGGEMTIHNVTKKMQVSGTLQVDKAGINITSKFTIDIEDYKVDTGLGGVMIGDNMNVEVNARCR